MTPSNQIPPLAQPVVLYCDETAESAKAAAVLDGLWMEKKQQPFPLDWSRPQMRVRRPAAVFDGGIWEGLDEIQALLVALRYWAEDAERRPNLFKMPAASAC
ncbi:hypothetical protein HY417_00365 [Candidatus Kaiserbacteria bacterium]|nr:hypothetical protein [Candidatus Kaiserbacteria bacterium]